MQDMVDGGATHIATTNRGLLSNYLEYQSEILIVAGAGGGSSESSDKGGNGGGESGTSGSGAYVGGGATQTSPGSKGDYDSVPAGFGYGGSAPYGNTRSGTYGGGGRRCRLVWRRSFKPSKWKRFFYRWWWRWPDLDTLET